MTAQMNSELRSAYDAYVALFWRFYSLPSDHPLRGNLAEAVDRADARWRSLTVVPAQKAVNRGDEHASSAAEVAHP